MTLWSVVVIHFTTVDPGARRLLRVGAAAASRSIVVSVAALISSLRRW